MNHEVDHAAYAYNKEIENAIMFYKKLQLCLTSFIIIT